MKNSIYSLLINKSLKHSGLKRKKVAREWYWQFDKIPDKEWELTWEGYHEFQ